MSDIVVNVSRGSQADPQAPGGRDAEGPMSEGSLVQTDILDTYRVAEFVTLARDGSPVCWPLQPEREGGRLAFNTGYVYPAKARNAQRNPRVAALFSDPTASGRSNGDPLVLVQGLAQVFDQDLQRNTERYVDQILRKGPLPFRLMVRTPRLRQLMVGYLARIWIEVVPRHEFVWARADPPPASVRRASRPACFSPGPGIELPPAVFEWLPHYRRPPTLAYVSAAGWPIVIRTPATVSATSVAVGAEIETTEGAPACLTYHRLIGNYTANAACLIRGHFDAAGRLIPEKIVGYGGSMDDRGLGSMKVLRMLWNFRRALLVQLEKEGRPLPVVRSTPSG